MKLSFLGAAREVTGSCYLVEAAGKRFLIDCGMKQGDDDDNAALSFYPGSLDFVLVTHAHIDHSGLLPLIVKNGFSGRIIATGATCALLKIMLLDSAHIQEADAQWSARKGKRAGEEPKSPLYDTTDAQNTLKLLTPCCYLEDIPLADGLTARFIDAGHLLGSAYIRLTITENGVTKSILFSGDIGNINRPIIKDPQVVSGADTVIMESTYGNRLHDETGNLPEQFAGIFDLTFRRGGNVVIPSFAVGRTQEILYIIREIKERGLVKSEPDFEVYVDSPLALEATSVYSGDLSDYADDETAALLARGVNPLSFPNLKLTRTAEESMRLNSDMTPKVIISSSGMCEAGRIRHHLKHNLWRQECSVIFVGYQARGTLGRILLDGAGKVKLFGEQIAVKASIYNLGFLSGHADKNGLLKWISNFVPKPGVVFVTHGEEEANLAFTETLKTLGYNAVSPVLEDTYDLASGALVSAGRTAARASRAAGDIGKLPAEERVSPVYGKLKALGAQLFELIGKSGYLSKKEQARFAEQLKALVDYWERQ